MYFGGVCCRDVQYFYSWRARTNARQRWIAENRGKPVYTKANETIIEAECQAAADAILSQNAWRFTVQLISTSLTHRARNLVTRDTWQRRLDTLLGRPEAKNRSPKTHDRESNAAGEEKPDAGASAKRGDPN